MSITFLTCLECGVEFGKETKYVTRGEGKFCSRTCSTKHRNNSQTPISIVCEHCGKAYSSVNKNSKYCSKLCCSKARILRNGKSGTGRSSLSIKVNRAVSTGTRQCFVCNWNLATCDIHHIIEKCNYGTDDFDNLTVLCPNCHRLIHSNLIHNPPTVSSRTGLSLHP